jgi:hypothetical protein
MTPNKVGEVVGIRWSNLVRIFIHYDAVPTGEGIWRQMRYGLFVNEAGRGEMWEKEVLANYDVLLGFGVV